MSNLNTDESIVSPDNLAFILFKTKGRLARPLYAIAVLMQTSLTALALLAMQYAFTQGGEDETLIILVVPILTLLLIWTIFSAVIKRLHDFGKTGALSLILLVPGVNAAFLVWLAMQRGTDGPNRYGYHYCH